MRTLVATCLVAFIANCSGEKKFKSTAQTGAAAKEPPTQMQTKPKANPENKPEAKIDTPKNDPPIPEPPGEPVESFGINFEDSPSGDNDYNDAVLCFKGKFKLQEQGIASNADQEISATTYSGSGCQHSIEITTIDAEGKVLETKSYPVSKQLETITLKISKGHNLDVKMTTTTDLCDPSQKRSMLDTQYAKILKTCNTEGD